MLASNSNYTIFADERGALYVIDISEPNVLTQEDQIEIIQSSLKTSFYLYTRDNPEDKQQLFIDDLDSIKNSYFNPNNPTRFVTHGWKGNTDAGSAPLLIRDAYLSVGDYNVILIDWREAAGSLLYWKVVKSVPLVAEHVAELIDLLESNMNLNPATTRVVGHSLGAHVAGLAARFAKSEMAEVIALDPAKLLFDSKGPGERVDKSDAKAVQVIHTNAGRLGMEQEIGDSDFYPNGGTEQPGCGWIEIGCAHSRSFLYYAESIRNPTGFRAGEVFMGGPVIDSNAKGKYILQTNSEAPYALG
ncbi:Pancreatic triacylglycerol lipase [Ooceraea biroi]|nr:Pancreatic triacylglycerol lipase [Ooceraea biroi]